MEPLNADHCRRICSVKVCTNSVLHCVGSCRAKCSYFHDYGFYPLTQVGFERIYLTPGRVLSSHGIYVTIELSVDDLNFIKRVTLCEGATNCYVRLGTVFVDDMFSNDNRPVVDTNSLVASEQPYNFTDDTTGPVLVNFTLNMDTAEVRLTFDETIRANGLFTTAITFQDQLTANQSHTLTVNDRRPTSTDGTVIAFTIQAADLLVIKSLGLNGLATSAATTYISHASSLITDTKSNPAQVRNDSSNALVAAGYVRDQTDPDLDITTVHLDMNSGLLRLGFDEPVDTATFNATAITLQNAQTGFTDSYNIMSASIAYTPTESLNTHIDIMLSAEDIRQIKLKTSLATAIPDTFVTFTSRMIADVAGNRVTAISGQQVATYQPDITPPELVDWDLDVNQGLMTLTFNDVTLVRTLQAQFITLQNSMLGDDDNNKYQLTGGTSASQNGYVIIVNITKTDLDQIKMRDRLATMNTTSYLTHTSDVIDDSANVAVRGIQTDAGKVVRSYTPDTTRPYLELWTLDLTRGSMTMQFSEAVNVSSLAITSIWLQNTMDSANSTEQIKLRGGVLLPNYTAVTFTLSFTIDDLNLLKKFDMLGTNVNDTYLAFNEFSIYDMNFNRVIEIPRDAAQRVLTFGDDFTAPKVVSFCYDADSAQLSLTFTETVNASSLNASRLILQDRPISTTNFQLRGGTVTSEDSTIVNVSLTAADRNEVQRIDALAINASTTHLLFDFAMVYDMAGRPIAQVAIGSADIRETNCFTPDTTEPKLRCWNLDMSNNTLVLYFDETIRTSTFNVSAATLWADQTASLAVQRHTFAYGNTSSGDATFLIVQLDRRDVDIITVLTQLAVSNTSSYLTYTPQLVTDMINNSITAASFVPVCRFTRDVTRPRLQSYDLDLTGEVLTLSFSESVNVTSIDISKFTFINTPSVVNATESHVLGTSSVHSANGPVVLVNMSYSDLNRIKQLTGLATSNLTTYLSLTPESLRDMAGNQLLPAAFAPAVKLYTDDRVQPTLVAYNLTMFGGVPPLVLQLEFSETVQWMSVNVTGIGFLVTANSTNVTYLTGGTLSRLDSTHITINITEVDKYRLQALPPLAQGVNNSYLRIEPFAVNDMNNNSVVRVPARNVLSHTADITPPELSSFSVDMDAGLLTLTFTEALRNMTFYETRITLQSDQISNSTTESITLGNSTYSTVAANILQVSLTLNDSNQIKKLTSLAINAGSTFVNLLTDVVRDLANNEANPISSNNALPLLRAVYTPDETHPRIESWDLNMNTRLLTIRLDETVNTTSLDTSGLTLQNSMSDAQQSHTLTGGFTTSPDGTTVVITVSIDDKNSIKELAHLATENSNTFLVARHTALTDMAGNVLNSEWYPRRALPVSEYTADAHRPTLERFDVDMNSGLLTLHFDETVNVSTLNISSLILSTHNITNASSYAQRVLLTSSTMTSNMADILIDLDATDFNEIKRLRICSTEDVCHLRFTEDTVRDMVNRSILAIRARRVYNFTADTTPPSLVEFTQFDLAQQLVVLTFNETVVVDNFNITTITLQDLFEGPLTNFTLTNGTLDSNDSTVVRFYLAASDVIDIQRDTRLCTRRGTCYLTFTSDLVEDVVGNNVVPVGQGAPGAIVRMFGHDGQEPRLSSFDLDLDAPLTLTLHFNEPVNAGTLDASQITLQSQNNTITEFVVLQSSSRTSSNNGRTIVVNLSATDVINVKRVAFLKGRNDTFISLTANTILDLAHNAPNRLTPVPTNNATQVDMYTEDSIPPVLTCFHLDMDRHQLTVTFNEPVKPLTLVCERLSLHSGPSATNFSRVLSNCSVTPATSANGRTWFTINIGAEDIRTLKLNYAFATEQNTSYLSLTEGAVTDMADVATLNSTRYRSCIYTADGSRASLVRYSIHMHESILNLTFDDVVLRSTFDARAITLQNAARRSLSYTLTSESITTSEDGYIISVQISHFDLLGIKTIGGMYRHRNQSYITVRASLIDDHNLVDIVPITDTKGLQVDLFVPDTVPPALDFYDLDMNSNNLTLAFTDTVNLSTFEVTAITLYSASINATTAFTLRGGLSVRSSNGTQITVTLTRDDANAVKRLRTLATGRNDTHLTINASSVLDLALNPLVGITNNNSRQVRFFINDTTGPVINSFNFDLDAPASLTLFFDETIDGMSVNPRAITLQGQTNTTSTDLRMTSFTLTGAANITRNDTTWVRIELTFNDTQQIKRQELVSINKPTTYLSVTSQLLVDMRNNSQQSIVTSDAQLVDVFTSDTTRPNLQAYDLDMDGQPTLLLTFDEVVRTSTFNITDLVLHSHDNNSLAMHRLTNATVSQANDIYVNLTLSRGDSNIIKLLRQLATDRNNTFVQVLPTFVADMSENKIIEVFSNASQQVVVFTNDTTPPRLESFTIDMDSGTLTMSFDETIESTLVNVSGITIQNQPLAISQWQQLTTSNSSMADSVYITVSLSPVDLNAVKTRLALATGQNDSYVRLTSAAISDMNNNTIETMVAGIRTTLHTADTTRPTLVSFTLDLTGNQLRLTFDEAVSRLTLNVTGLQLYASPTANTTEEMFTLTASSSSASDNSTTIFIDVHEVDLNVIKSQPLLATSLNSTYLLMSNNTVLDMTSNPVRELLVARQVENFINDTVPPVLRQFNLDINTATLSLSFTETVNATTLDMTQLALHSDRSILPSSSYNLTGGSHTDLYTPTINVTLTQFDLNNIKLLFGLATEVQDTHLALSSSAIMDMNGNSVTQLTSATARPARKLVPDTMRIILNSFDLDMDTEKLTLYFSEAAYRSSINITELWLQGSETQANSSRRLTGHRGMVWNLTTVTITLATNDINVIKLDRRLATESSNTYLRFSPLFIQDTNANTISPLATPDAGLKVSDFTADLTSPMLTGFTLDMDSPELLRLTFNEPIDASSFDVSSITMQGAANITVRQSYTLTTSNVDLTDNTSVLIRLSLVDSNAIKALPEVKK